MSDTQNVKIGTCRIYYDGQDLGYTQGGVDVTVTTDTHQVTVDQFGKSTINDIIQGRNCMVKVPMAETTLENLVTIMPGATLISSGDAQASGTITVAAEPAVGDTLTVQGVVFTFENAAAESNQIAIGASVAATAANIAAALGSYEDPGTGSMSYAVSGAVVTATSVDFGSEGNALTLAKSSAGLTLSGATLAGGVDGELSVSVATGVGTSLLSLAKPLVLHPLELAETDRSQDFVIPLAATAGAVKFTYKLDTERLFDVTFTAYPNSTTNELFSVGAH